MNRPLSLLALATAAVLAFPTASHATERRFAFTYETTTTPKGAVELENWVTFERLVLPGKDLNALSFRHEIEYGITDRLQLGLYVANWGYDNFSHQTRYDSSSLELIYNITNPNTSWLGSAAYLEITGGEHEFELEGKLLLQKNFGPVIVAYNAILEAQWEGERFGDFQEHNGEFGETLGISYEVSKNFSFGAELQHEIGIPDWSEAADSVVWAGPNVSFRYGRAYATVSGLFQCTNNKEEPDVITRLIFGVSF